MDQMEDRTISVPEAGRRVGLSKNAAYKAAKAGEIPALRFGRKLRVPIVALERMLSEVGSRGQWSPSSMRAPHDQRRISG
jgi:excisionase family DNA binding protein